MTGEPIIVQVVKYDGSPYRSWPASVVNRAGSLLILEAEFETEVNHSSLGTISKGTRTIEYYWMDRWFNVFKFLDPKDRVSLFYCNLNMPPSLEGQVLTYVDLDLDIVVSPDLSYQVLDLDEFEKNSEEFGYSAETIVAAGRATKDLIRMIETREFPFDHA